MQKLFLLVLVFSKVEFSFSQIHAGKKIDSTTVEISMIFNAADDMEKGRYTNSGSKFFNYYYRTYGFTTIFKEDSVYKFIQQQLKSSNEAPATKRIAWVRMVLNKNEKKDTVYFDLQPHNDLVYNGRSVKIKSGAILTAYIYKILTEKYERRDFQVVGSGVDASAFLITRNMLFRQ